MARTRRKLKKKTSKLKLTVVSSILAISLVLSFALPAMSQTNSMLNSSARRISNTEAWWDSLWETTFNPAPLALPDPNASAGILNPPSPPTSTSTLPGLPLPVPSLPPVSSGGNLPAPPPATNIGSGGNNLSLYFFSSATRTILALGLVAWLFSYGRAMIESPTLAQGIYTFFKLFVPIVLALIFISNQGYYSRVLALGMRDMVNSWSSGVMNLTITDYSMRAAIQDQLIAEDAKQRVINQFNTCEAINPPAVALPSATRPDPTVVITDAQRKNYEYLECLEGVRKYAQNELDIAENQRLCSNYVCKLYRRLMDMLTGVTEGVKKLEEFRRENAGRLNEPEIQAELRSIEANVNFSQYGFDVSQGNTPGTSKVKEMVVSLVNPSQSFLYFTQWMWISFLELAMFLNGLFAPMFFAVSIIPGKDKMVNVFLVEFLTIGLAKMAYVLIIGIVAIQQSAPEAGLLDNTFFMTLGIFAPAVSLAVVTVGGIAAASSYKSQSVGATAAIGGLVSSGAATIAYSMARNADKHR